jgi:RND family efflux transporter MFP subunit
MNRSLRLIFIAVFGASLGLALLLAPGLAAADNDKGAQPPAPAIVEARLRMVEDVYSADAVIEAVHQATVGSQLSGAVVEIFVDAGDRVKKGQVLARIDTRDTDAQVAAGRAAVAQADAQLAQARLNLERTQSLLTQNFVSRAALDKAEADFKAAQAAADAARAGRVQADTARSYAELRSPIDGVVTRRLLDPGEVASPGLGIVAVHDPSALRAVGNLPQFVLPKVTSAAGATVELPQLGRSIKATHVTILPASDARLLSTQIRADLPTGDTPGVTPGAAAKILVPTGHSQKLVVPASTLIRRGELTAVNVVAADGRPQLRQVRLGTSVAGGGVEILAGLSDGERVFVNPLAQR